MSQDDYYHGLLSVSADNEREQEFIKRARDAFRRRPELHTADNFMLLADNLAAAGLFDLAHENHGAAAQTGDRAKEAEANFKAYRDLCERKQWADALQALRRAAHLDRRFAPFDMDRYKPQTILGAGGFGAAFHCRDSLNRDQDVAIKSLYTAEMARDVNDVFREAQALSDLHHPAFVKVWHWDFAHADKTRPYIIMEYLPGASLQAYLDTHGVLLAADLVAVARQVAVGMQGAHRKHIFHRDLKPENILVRKTDAGWEVKIIDFGLAVRPQTIRKSLERRSSQRSLLDESLAGTAKYAAPEQKGELPGVKIGPQSDVYAFGKTCCEALFQTTEPRRRDFDKLPPEYQPLANLLDDCLNKEPKDRPADFAAVLKKLDELDANESQQSAAQKQKEQEELARLQAEGEAKLRQLLGKTFERTQGKPTKEDSAPATALCREYRIPKERADTIVGGVREQWREARRAQQQLRNQVGEELFDEMDTNHDGIIQPSELESFLRKQKEKEAEQQQEVARLREEARFREVDAQKQREKEEEEAKRIAEQERKNKDQEEQEARRRRTAEEKEARLRAVEFANKVKTSDGLQAAAREREEFEEQHARRVECEAEARRQATIDRLKEIARPLLVTAAVLAVPVLCVGLCFIPSCLFNRPKSNVAVEQEEPAVKKEPQDAGTKSAQMQVNWQEIDAKQKGAKGWAGRVVYNIKKKGSSSKEKRVFGDAVKAYSEAVKKATDIFKLSPQTKMDKEKLSKSQYYVHLLQGQWNLTYATRKSAENEFESALRLYPDDGEAKSFLQEAKSKMKSEVPPLPEIKQKENTQPIRFAARITKTSGDLVTYRKYIAEEKDYGQEVTQPLLQFATVNWGVDNKKTLDHGEEIEIGLNNVIFRNINGGGIPVRMCVQNEMITSIILTAKAKEFTPPEFKQKENTEVPPLPLNEKIAFTNAIGMKFNLIKPGTFLRGSPPNETGRQEDETQRRVTITRAFYIGVHPVTEEQWRDVMTGNPKNVKGDPFPKTSVSWDQCNEFCKKLSAKEGRPFRLPTEAEWEYACRAGTTTAFHFGNTISAAPGKESLPRKRTPVGRFPANAWGLHDMHGNVYQWCADWYGPYPQADVVDPEVQNEIFLVEGTQKNSDGRVVRGGSWFANPGNCRAASRWYASAKGKGSEGIGFRVCFGAD